MGTWQMKLSRQSKNMKRCAPSPATGETRERMYKLNSPKQRKQESRQCGHKSVAAELGDSWYNPLDKGRKETGSLC